jgi:Reverse transcriptase (RNA-dependent DNA polymerase)
MLRFNIISICFRISSSSFCKLCARTGKRLRGCSHFLMPTSRSKGGILAGSYRMVFRKMNLYFVHILRKPACNSASPSITIRSSLIFKEKYLASGEFEKLKAKLVAGGDQQDEDMYDDLSAPTVSTSSVFTILSITAHEGRKASVLDIGGAFLNAEMKTGVLVHISDLLVPLQPSYKKYQDAKGSIVVLLNRVLYGCVASAALWYENLRETMTSLGYERNPHDICVFNKTGKQGVQCTAAVHFDDLLISSVDKSMIESLAEGLRLGYGEITKSNGTTLIYLGMVLDFSYPGETRVTMKEFVEDILKSS